MKYYNESEAVEKGKMSYPKTQSAGEAPRAKPVKGRKTYRDDQSAFLARRGDPEKAKVSYKCSRYK